MSALHLIADLDDGLVVSAADRARIDAADAHASAVWHRRNQSMAELWRQGGCVVCGIPLGDAPGDECDDCVIAHDINITRLIDL
jgi:hypothetical protein